MSVNMTLPVAAVKSAAQNVFAYLGIPDDKQPLIETHIAYGLLVLCIIYVVRVVMRVLFARGVETPRARALCDKIHTGVDSYDGDATDVCEVARVGGKRVASPICIIAVQEARCRLGICNDNKANRLMIGKFIRDWMRERGMRPSHIAKYSVIALECYFVPTEAEVFAAEIRSAAQARRAAMGSRPATH
jgi:hypothetical protein